MENTTKPIVLVTGANGQLGNEFQVLHWIYSDLDFVFCDRQELDISNAEKVAQKIAELKPTAVVNCAAYTNVEKAEDETESANLFNGQAIEYLANACNSVNATLVHISTDYVFDGSKNAPYVESDEVNPINAYGRSKLLGEKMATSAEKHYIIRVAWLYSTFGNNFFKTMIRLAKERGELKVVSDQFGCPTYARYLANDILTLLEKTLVEKKQIDYGTYHYSHEGKASWYEFAKEIVLNTGLNVPVYAVNSEAFPTKAIRPKYSKLNPNKWNAALDGPIHTWKEALMQCITNAIEESTHEQ
jgi:dTDP-4-dehydrorhamnose reductase